MYKRIYLNHKCKNSLIHQVSQITKHDEERINPVDFQNSNLQSIEKNKRENERLQSAEKQNKHLLISTQSEGIKSTN